MLIQNMIYLVIRLQNEVSHHLLHCSCVVMHRGHKKRERERFEVHESHQQISPASHQRPNASAVSAHSCLMSLSPPLSLICVSFTLSLHAIMCIRAMREKNMETDTYSAAGLETHAVALLSLFSRYCP